MSLFSKISTLNGIGGKREVLFNAKGIYCILDLLFYLPKNFKDFSRINRLSDITNKEALYYVQIKNTPQMSFRRKGPRMFKFDVFDASGKATIYYFNMPYLATNFNADEKIYVFGKMSVKDDKRSFSNPMAQKVLNKDYTFLPVYPNIHGVSQNMIISTVEKALKSITTATDYLSDAFKSDFGLQNFYEAHRSNHFPDTLENTSLGKKRFSIEQMLVLLCFLDMQVTTKLITKNILNMNQEKTDIFLDSFGFSLTTAQLAAINDIKVDLSSGLIMNRLIQGDVGSGKTVVAFFAMYLCHVNGYQSIMMAPTEVLAKQHYKNAKTYFSAFNISIGMLTGAMSKKEKNALIEKLETGEISMVFGTHALLYSEINYKNLNLAITDEQHRFGVAQKSKISYGGKISTLVMSATPIPRTLALILYSNIDVSIINELPKGRKKIKTHIVSDTKRKDMYTFIKTEVDKGYQCYVVCALIESEDDEKSVYNVMDELQKKFKFDRIAVLHGKMKDTEKQDIMTNFNAGTLNILVCTTVIEVGIDVSNATIIAIEDAHKFGMSTLHQLRGRVGRGMSQSYCFLVSDVKNDRLDIVEKENDGFKLAEKDLETRGPGQFLGKKQHGLDDFYMQNLFSDSAILSQSKMIYEKMKLGAYKQEYDIIKNNAQTKYNRLLEDISFN